MPRRSTLALFLASALAASVVIDRVAVIVGREAIKLSDINRDLRVTQFLNREPPDLGAAARRQAAERLIDQLIIRDAIKKGDYAHAAESEIDATIRQLREQRFDGSASRMAQDLSRHGLAEDQLGLQLQWQFDVLKFIDQRFRPGVVVTPDEVRAYYDQHRATLERSYPNVKTFAGLEPKIRASLEGERLNQAFEDWIKEARKRTRIEYRQEAFQ
jgi:hypothetical protein